MKSPAITLVLLLCLVSISFAQWIPVPDPPDSFQGIELLYAGEDRIYAGTFNGRIFGSADHADTWVEVADGLPAQDYSPVSGMIIVDDWFVMSRFGLTAEDTRNFRSQRVGRPGYRKYPVAEPYSAAAGLAARPCRRWRQSTPTQDSLAGGSRHHPPASHPLSQPLPVGPWRGQRWRAHWPDTGSLAEPEVERRGWQLLADQPVRAGRTLAGSIKIQRLRRGLYSVAVCHTMG